jgi:hypothetical protein
MPRFNKITQRAFADIAETHRKKGAYDKFLGIDDALGLPVSDKLRRLKEDYKTLAHDMSANIKTLANIEIIITQIRAKEVINSNLRLSLSRNYIYARSSFYREDNKINDIRVCVGVGLTEDHGTDLDKLLHDKVFRDVCVSTLQGAMDREIETNINQLNFIYKDEERI